MVFEQAEPDARRARRKRAVTIQITSATSRLFPLAIPLHGAGPGAIAATILLAGRTQGEPVQLLVLMAVIAFVMVSCLLVFLADRISTWLGVTGNIVLSRLLGVILAALAVQFVIDGVRAILAG
jgi:multiple antibiotic resistance protein